MNSEKPDQFGQFLSSYLEELKETPDTDIIASEKDAPADFGSKLLAKAKSEAAARRFRRAKAGLNSSRLGSADRAISTLTPAAARAFLAKYAHDPKLTLAARNLAELSDEDVVRLSQNLENLVSEDEESDPDNS